MNHLESNAAIEDSGNIGYVVDGRIDDGEKHDDSVEDREFLLYKARRLLQDYPRLLRRKKEQEYRMDHTPRFTKDDAISELCGVGGVSYDGPHVQTSNLPDPTAKAAMNIDAVLERMNRDAIAYVSRGYKHLVNDINNIRLAYSTMDEETAFASWQILSEQISYAQVVDTAGNSIRYASSKKLEKEAVETMASVLEWSERKYDASDIGPSSGTSIGGGGVANE